MEFTVGDILKLPILSETTVISGKQGLDRVIKCVSFIESPDSINWIMENDFLITNAYFIKNDKEIQNKLIQKLAKMNSAGLGIKLNRFLDDIPEEIVKQANELSFPLLMLPYNVSHSQIINAITEAVHSEKILSQEYFDKVNLTLPLKEILYKISVILFTLINNPIIIYSPYVKDFVCSKLGNEKYYLLEIIDKFLNNDKSIRIEKIESIPEIQAKRYEISYQDSREKLLVVPIETNNQKVGEIIIWETIELSKQDYISIKQASIMIHLLVVKEKALSDMKDYFKDSFFSDLLFSTDKSKEILLKKASSFGWNLTQSYGLLIIDFDKNNVNMLHFKDELSSLNHTIEKDRMYVLDNKQEIIILYEARNPNDVKHELINLGKIIEKMYFKEFSDCNIRIGIGRYYTNISQLHESYKEARNAVDLGEYVYEHSKVVHFDDLGIYRILCSCKKQNELEEFYKETVYKLIDFDKENNTDYYKTIETFINNNGNTADTAKELFVHYNTIRYRIDKVKAITGIDLCDADKRFDFQVGMKISKLYKETNYE